MDRIKISPVRREAIAVIDALLRVGVEVGSCRANQFIDDAPPERRLLCVALADTAAIPKFAADLRRELTGDPDVVMEAVALLHRVMVATLPDAVVVTFLDIEAIEIT